MRGATSPPRAQIDRMSRSRIDPASVRLTSTTPVADECTRRGSAHCARVWGVADRKDDPRCRPTTTTAAHRAPTPTRPISIVAQLAKFKRPPVQPPRLDMPQRRPVGVAPCPAHPGIPPSNVYDLLRRHGTLPVAAAGPRRTAETIGEPCVSPAIPRFEPASSARTGTTRRMPSTRRRSAADR
jgi:hypothetical protein